MDKNVLTREATTPLRRQLARIEFPGHAPAWDGEGQMTYRGPYPEIAKKLVSNAFNKHYPMRTNVRKNHIVIRFMVGGTLIDFGTVAFGLYSQALEKAARLSDCLAYRFRGKHSHPRYNFPAEQPKADCELPAIKKLLDEWAALFKSAGLEDSQTAKQEADSIAQLRHDLTALRAEFEAYRDKNKTKTETVW